MEMREVKSVQASLYRCQRDLYEFNKNVEALESILRDTAKAIDAKIAKILSYRYGKRGVTCTAIIKQSSGSEASHITISTYPEHKFASLDIESCIASSDMYNGLLTACEPLRPRRVEGIYVTSGFSEETKPEYKKFRFVGVI